MASVGTLWSTTADFSAVVGNSYLVEFPGVFNMSLWESEADATKFYGTNGTYISSDSGDSTTLTDLGAGFATLTIADTTGILVGMWVAVDDVSAGANATGYYEIVTVVAGTITIASGTALDGAAALASSDTCSYYIGGIATAFTSTASLQNVFDTVGPICGATNTNAINNLDILCHASSAVTVTATIDIDSIEGSTTTKVRMAATNSSFVRDGTLLEITTVSTLANGLFDWSSAATGRYVIIQNIDFNGGGKDATRAVFCVGESVATGTTDNISFISCKFRGASSHGVNQESDEWNFIDCSFTLNGGSGIETFDGAGNFFNGCEFGTNDRHGMWLAGGANCINCISYNNGQDSSVGHGFRDDQAQKFFNCVAFGNFEDGFHIDNNSGSEWQLVNNVSMNNTGYGYNLDGLTDKDTLVLGFNSAFNNTAGPLRDTGDLTDAQFQEYGDGNNITTDPDFESTTAGNVSFLRPKSTSPLLDIGAGKMIQLGFDIGTLSAIAGGAGGGVMPLTGLLS